MDWLLTPIAQMTDPIAPADIPAWAWVIIAAVSGWFAKELWPWLKSKWDREDARTARDDTAQDERFLKAFEQSAAAQAQNADALKSVAQSLDLFARNSVAVTFELAELRREMRSGTVHGSTPTERETLAQMLRQEVK